MPRWRPRRAEVHGAALLLVLTVGQAGAEREERAAPTARGPLPLGAPALLVPACGHGRWQPWPGAASRPLALVTGDVLRRGAGTPLAGGAALPHFACVTVRGVRPGAADAGGQGRCIADYWSPQLPSRPGALGCRGDVLRFTLRAGDVEALDARRAHPAERVEVGQWFKQPPQGEQWVSFAMPVLPGPATTGKWTELRQLHNTQDPSERTSSLAVAQGFGRNDGFCVVVRGSADDSVREPTPATTVYRASSFPRGVFRRFVYRLNYLPMPAGALDLWIDGVQVVAYRGPVGYRDRLGPYWKCGIYLEPAHEPLGVDYANIEVGGPKLRLRITAPRTIRAD